MNEKPYVTSQILKVSRYASRAILVNQFDQCLLLKFELPWVKGPTWILPGGGREQSETAPECVVREVLEETGLRIATPTEPSWQCDFNFQWREKLRRVVEHHYIIPVEHFEPQTEFMLDYEKESVLAFKWWSVAALLETSENISPRQLPELMQRYQKQQPLSPNSDTPLLITDPLPNNYFPS